MPDQWCSVTPPMAHAARPVDAVIYVVRESSRDTICLRRCDLPTPAPPVKKTDWPPSTTSRITSCCSVVRFAVAVGESLRPAALLGDADHAGEHPGARPILPLERGASC